MSKETETTGVKKAEALNPTLKSVAKYKRGQNVEYKVFHPPCLADRGRISKTRNFEEISKSYRNGLEK
jgi:hypothetical protein